MELDRKVRLHAFFVAKFITSCWTAVLFGTSSTVSPFFEISRKGGSAINKKWYIWFDGKEIPVTEEVYRTYKRAEWREEKQNTVRAARESSYDFMLENDFDGQADMNQKLLDEIVEDKLLLDILLATLDKLTEDERSLIDSLFYKEKSEREISRETGIPHPTIHSRKVSILQKLKKLLERNI